MQRENISSIIDDYKKKNNISDKEVDEVMEICRRKIELNNLSDDYLLLLLPDELKNYCIRRAVTAISLLNTMQRKEILQ